MPDELPANPPEFPGRFFSALGPAGDFEYATKQTGTVNPTDKRTVKRVALVVRQPGKTKK